MNFKAMLFAPLFFSFIITNFSNASNVDLEKLVDDMIVDVDLNFESTRECSRVINGHYTNLFLLRTEMVNFEKLTKNKIDRIVRKSFNLRLRAKDRIKELLVVDEDAQKCLSSLRAGMRALRYLEDYLVEIAYANESKDPKDYTTFTGSGINFLKNDRFSFVDQNDLKSGDVILSRGGAYSSAAISRVGIDDTQFSHLSLVYKNEDTNELFTSEAHIEIGSVVEPIQKHIDQNNVRSVLFRYSEDQSIAHKAAKYMNDKILYHLKRTGQNIMYDFGMNYYDHSKLFCSEIIFEGYFKGSGFLLDVPMYKTKFSKGSLYFLNALGIDVNQDNISSFQTFGPGDMEYDPRFELVAEWKNPAKIKDARYKDAILYKIFEWMETKGYRFDIPLDVKIKSDAFWLGRRTLLIRKVFENKMPLNMTTAQLKLFLVLDIVGKALYEKLEEFEKRKNAPLTMYEMFEQLEKIRVQDERIARIWGHKLLAWIVKKYDLVFYKYFHPKE